MFRSINYKETQSLDRIPSLTFAQEVSLGKLFHVSKSAGKIICFISKKKEVSNSLSEVRFLSSYPGLVLMFLTSIIISCWAQPFSVYFSHSSCKYTRMICYCQLVHFSFFKARPVFCLLCSLYVVLISHFVSLIRIPQHSHVLFL